MDWAPLLSMSRGDCRNQPSSAKAAARRITGSWRTRPRLTARPGSGPRQVWNIACVNVRDPDAGPDAQDTQAHADRAFGAEYWNEVIKFDTLVKYGKISPSDLELLHRTDSLDEAYEIITEGLTKNALGSPGPTL